MVSELCQWMQQLSAPAAHAERTEAERAAAASTALSCDDVRKLFDINLEGPAARALAVQVKELGCVPPSVAKDARAPRVSLRQCSRAIPSEE